MQTRHPNLYLRSNPANPCKTRIGAVGKLHPSCTAIAILLANNAWADAIYGPGTLTTTVNAGPGTTTIVGGTTVTPVSGSAAAINNASYTLILDPSLGMNPGVINLLPKTIGINATNGMVVVKPGGAAITTTATSGYGIQAAGATTSVDTTDLSVATSGASAYGLRILNGASASITGGSISTTGLLATGIDIRGNTGQRTTGTANNVNVTVSGNASGSSGTYGVFVGDGALMRLSGGQITTNGPIGIGVFASGTSNGSPSTALLSNVAIHTTSTATNTYGAYGVSASLGGRAEVTGGTITTEGPLAVGLRVSESGSVLIASNTSVVTHGLSASGVVASGGSHASVTGLDIQTTGENTAGLLSYGNGTLISATDTRIAATGLFGNGVYAYNQSQLSLAGGSVSTSGQQAFGVVAQSGSTVTITRDAEGVGTSVSTSGAGADAISVKDAGAGTTTTLSATGASFHASGADAAGLRMSGSPTGVGAPPLLAYGTPTAEGEPAPSPSVDGVAVQQASTENASFVESTLTSDNGPAIAVQGPSASISFLRSTVTGNGTLLSVIGSGSSAGAANLTADDSVLTGAITTSADSISNVTLQNGSVWNVTGSSTLTNLSNNGSGIAFAPTAQLASAPQSGSSYSTVTVRGNYSGNDGTVRVNSRLGQGGSLANQFSDRVLILGNAAGTTIIEVEPAPGSTGAITSPTGVINATEGISVVQVAESSSVGTFELRGGYVVAPDSPYQYRLYAYGPDSVHGAADATQSLVGNGGNSWDYRLQTAYVTPSGPVDPESPGPSPGANVNVPAGARLAVAPQVAAYLTAPSAVLGAGFADLDTLHRRLGEVRDDRDLQRDEGSGEMFVRAYGGSYNYTTNQSFDNYGYNATGDYTALQLGGNVYKHRDDNNGIWRFGLAGTLGWIHFEPEAVDGPSSARSDTYRLSGYGTYQSQHGWYVDSILSVGWFNGQVSTDARDNVMRLDGNDYAASIEAGYPLAIGAGMNLEPQIQLVGQHVSFRNQTDVDDLAVNIGSQNELLGRLGARLTRAFDIDKDRVTPYAAVDVLHAFISGTNVQVGDASFTSGDYGDALQVSLGVNATASERMSLYGRVSYQHSLGDAGFRGWLFNAGARFLF